MKFNYFMFLVVTSIVLNESHINAGPINSTKNGTADEEYKELAMEQDKPTKKASEAESTTKRHEHDKSTKKATHVETSSEHHKHDTSTQSGTKHETSAEFEEPSNATIKQTKTKNSPGLDKGKHPKKNTTEDENATESGKPDNPTKNEKELEASTKSTKPDKSTKSTNATELSPEHHRHEHSTDNKAKSKNNTHHGKPLLEITNGTAARVSMEKNNTDPGCKDKVDWCNKVGGLDCSHETNQKNCEKYCGLCSDNDTEKETTTKRAEITGGYRKLQEVTAEGTTTTLQKVAENATRGSEDEDETKNSTGSIDGNTTTEANQKWEDEDISEHVCKTRPTKSTENLDPDKECKFPFFHEGTKFTKCTLVDHKGVYWCATDKTKDVSPKIAKIRSYIKWGACEEECPKRVSEGRDLWLQEHPMDNGLNESSTEQTIKATTKEVDSTITAECNSTKDGEGCKGINIPINETRGGNDLHEGHDDHESEEPKNEKNVTNDDSNETKIGFHDLDYLMEYEDLLKERGDCKPTAANGTITLCNGTKVTLEGKSWVVEDRVVAESSVENKEESATTEDTDEDIAKKEPQATRVIWDPSKYIDADEETEDATNEDEQPEASAVRLTGIKTNQKDIEQLLEDYLNNQRKMKDVPSAERVEEEQSGGNKHRLGRSFVQKHFS